MVTLWPWAAPSSPTRCGCVPLGTLLAVCELLHVVAAALSAPLCSLPPADIPASLSARVFNEEINADPGLTAHALLVGHFPSQGSEAQRLFVNRSPLLGAGHRVRDAPDSPSCTWVRQAPVTWAGVNWTGVAWVIVERFRFLAAFSCLERKTLGRHFSTQSHQGQQQLPSS